MTSAPRSIQAPLVEKTSVANTAVHSKIQAKQQRSHSHSILQSCPLDQITSASALSEREGPLAPALTQLHDRPKANLNYGDNYGTISPENLHLSLLKTALDGFFDSILVIHPNGQILQSNGQANRLFANALPQSLQPQPCVTQPSASQAHPRAVEATMTHPLQPLLDEIWRVATAMMDGQTEFPNQDIILDSEMAWEGEAFRIRVRWMDLAIQQQPCLLITIEDLQQTAVNQVNVDRWKYKLTPREAEVWSLKRQGYSYKAIATTLYVSENTVKKHLKNIQVKRREKDGVDA